MKYLFLPVTLAMGALTNLLASDEIHALLGRTDPVIVPAMTYAAQKSSDAAEQTNVLSVSSVANFIQPEIESQQFISEQTEDQLLEKLVALLAKKGLSVVPIKPLNQTPEVVESTLTSQNLYRKLQEAFKSLDLALIAVDYPLIFGFNKLLMPNSLAVVEIDLIKKRVDAAEQVVRSYFDKVIEYKNWNIYQALRHLTKEC